MEARISSALTIKYEDVGQGSPVVLLHAFPLCRAMWQPQLDVISKEYRVLAPDLRGFGGTSAFEGIPSIEQMADDIVALLDALNVPEPVALAGLSMGGYVALALARKYPQRLRALILADTRAEPDTAAGKAKREEMIQLAASKGALAVAEQMAPNLLSPVTREKLPLIIEEVVTMGAAQTPEGIADALRALRDRPDAHEWLSEIKVPTLVLVGSEDTLTPVQMAQILQKGIAGAWLISIQEAGHLSNLEQPDHFNQAVLSFLRSL